jgi:hypothetical protein
LQEYDLPRFAALTREHVDALCADDARLLLSTIISGSHQQQ